MSLDCHSVSRCINIKFKHFSQQTNAHTDRNIKYIINTFSWNKSALIYIICTKTEKWSSAAVNDNDIWNNFQFDLDKKEVWTCFNPGGTNKTIQYSHSDTSNLRDLNVCSCILLFIITVLLQKYIILSLYSYW